MLFSFNINAQNDTIQLDECVVTFYRPNKNVPVTYSDINKSEIDLLDIGQEPASIISQTPSINTYSDAGNDIGYTYFRLRGIDQTRINMTFDGVPLNEPEDQGVYFNNYPDFINSVNSIQIQRGVGVSSNGTAGYGGSINFESPLLFNDTSLEISVGYGSFNSYRAYAEYKSGKRKNFGFYLRATTQHTDGFKDHASNTSSSVLYGTAYTKKKHTLKLIGFLGRQQNQMAWLGASDSTLKTNPTYNANNSEERDDFLQSLIKLQHIYKINENSKIASTVYYNYLHGNYDFDLNTFLELPIGTIDSAFYNYNLEHHFIGAFTNYSYIKNNLTFNAGVHGNTFNRTHIGSELKIGQLYSNVGYKNEASVFTKATYRINDFVLFGDISYRYTTFDYVGDVEFDKMNWQFISPRIGLKYELNTNHYFYYSIGSTGREPTRTDLFYGEDNLNDPTAIADIKPETVIDNEFGFKSYFNKGHFFTNLYYMQFKNEIVLNGQIGPNSIVLHENVDNSYRSGIETDIRFDLTDKFVLTNNSSFSHNRITGDSVDIIPIMTPSIIVNQNFFYKIKSLTFGLLIKYQSKSYIDFENDNEIPEFYTVGLLASYSFRQFTITGRANNLTNQEYYSNGNSNVYGSPVYFRSAPVNFYVSLKWNL